MLTQAAAEVKKKKFKNKLEVETVIVDKLILFCNEKKQRKN